MAKHRSVRVAAPWRRLAVPLLLLALAACNDDKLTEASDPVAPVELAQGGKKVSSLAISPDSASVAPGLTAQFAAKGVRRDGSTVPVTVTWTATGGTITSSGLYTAGTSVGTFRVIAKTATLADSATVRISTTAPTVTSLAVTPATDTLAPGATQKFVATGRLSDGSTTPVRVKWAATGGIIDTAGVYTAGSASGSYRVTAVQTGGTLADTAAVSIPAQAPPSTVGSCLSQSGPTVTMSGVQRTSSTSYYTSLADNTKLDASTAQLLSTANQGVSVAGGSRVCFHGGQVAGSWSPDTPWETLHDTYAIVARLPSLTFENFQVFAYGDGITLDAQNASNWTIRGVHLKYIRDDCVENDFLNSGLIDDSFFDGCYSGLSARHYTTAQDGSNNVVVVQNSLWRASQVDPAGAYRNTGGNIGFFKWDAIGPKIKLYNNVYRADGPATFSDQPLMPPADKLVDCSGNVMVWLGSGPFPERLPSCYTLMTGQAGLDYWNNAVARWRAAHPSTLPDVVAPIVAIRSPASGTTLTGTVTLTATAVDDQDMAGVQLKLNGQAIGSEVTTEAPITKFSLPWDSRGKPNGSYTLTATGRDAAGNTKTSAGITVTISN